MDKMIDGQAVHQCKDTNVPEKSQMISRNKKDAYYFPHDATARNDPKITKLRMQMGPEGYGIFFMILELLRAESGYNCVTDFGAIAYDLHTDADKVKSVITDYGLFALTEKEGYFYSPGQRRRMEPLDNIRRQRSQAGKKSAEKRAERNDRSTTVEAKDNDRPKKTQQLNKSKVKDIRIENNKTNNKGNTSSSGKKKLPVLGYQECVDFWLKDFHPGWGFSGKEGKSMKTLIDKIKKTLRRQAIPESEETVYSAFKTLCHNLPDFYKSQDLSVLNSKYDSIIDQIKNLRNGNITAKTNARQSADYFK